MGNSSSVTSNSRHQYMPDSTAPVILVTYQPEGYGGFTYSDKHAAYTNNLSKLEDIPGPSSEGSGPLVDEPLPEPVNGKVNVNEFDIPDAVTTLIEGSTSDVHKVRLLWKWLTAQDIHGTLYKLTEEFDEVEYQLQKLKNTDKNEGNTFAALFALLCSYGNIPCVIIRGYVKGSLYNTGQPITKKHVAEGNAEWNAVYVDGSWRLLDPFWGSCCKNPDGTILPYTSDWYLFTEPRQFLFSHFPEKAVWQLVENPITLQDFADQPVLKDRFFALGMQDSVTPSCSVVSTEDGEINILFPLDSDRAKFQEFECLVKEQTPDGWESIRTSSNDNQLDFIYLMKDLDLVTLSIYVRFPNKGTFRVEVVGRETRQAANELKGFDWIAIYRVEVKGLPNKIVMFPKKQTLGWGPGDMLKELGIEAISHQEGLIKFFPDDVLQMEFKLRGRKRNIRLRDKLYMKNGVIRKQKQVQEDDWFSKEDGKIVFTVQLKKAADYMLQICAEVDGRDVGSVCNYLIICVGEIKDKVLEEIRNLKPRLQDAVNNKNLYELRRMTGLIKSKALHRHVLMKDMYTEAVAVMEKRQKHEEIMRKLKNLPIPSVVREIRGYKQITNIKVEKVIKATLILLGDKEKDLKTWEQMRRRILMTEKTESLAGKVENLKDTISNFISDRNNRSAIERVDQLLRDINTEDMARISLAAVPLLEVIKLIVEEYRRENPTAFTRRSTVIDIDPIITPGTSGTLDTPVFEMSTIDDAQEDPASVSNHAVFDQVNSEEEIDKEDQIISSDTNQRELSAELTEIISNTITISPRVES